MHGFTRQAIIATTLPDFALRQAAPDDCGRILGLIRELAVYEKLEHELVATEELLAESLFGENAVAEALLAEYRQQVVGYALFFRNFSTFTGRPGIYLEDIFVQPAMRGCGYGECMLAYLAKLALERNYTRVEWSVLDWNEPSIRFYRTLGAVGMEEWTIQRMSGDALHDLAAKFEEPDRDA